MAPTKSWMASVKSQVEMQVETMTPDFNRVAAEVRTIASLVQAKGMEMAEDVAGSKTLAIISYRISVAMDFAGNSKIFKVRQLIQGLGGVVRAAVPRLSRTARSL